MCEENQEGHFYVPYKNYIFHIWIIFVSFIYSIFHLYIFIIYCPLGTHLGQSDTYSK